MASKARTPKTTKNRKVLAHSQETQENRKVLAQNPETEKKPRVFGQFPESLENPPVLPQSQETPGKPAEKPAKTRLERRAEVMAEIRVGSRVHHEKYGDGAYCYGDGNRAVVLFHKPIKDKATGFVHRSQFVWPEFLQIVKAGKEKGA